MGDMGIDPEKCWWHGDCSQRATSGSGARYCDEHYRVLCDDRPWRESVKQRYGILPVLQLANFESADAWYNWVDINANDAYSKAVTTYAELWARLMQLRMEQGATVAAVAAQASHDVDCDPVRGGITAFMYGAAVHELTQVWAHGEQLRIWHNLQVAIGDEGARANASGGVLNPAVMSLG